MTDEELKALHRRFDDHADQIYALFDRVAAMESMMSRLSDRIRDLDNDLSRRQ